MIFGHEQGVRSDDRPTGWSFFAPMRSATGDPQAGDPHLARAGVGRRTQAMLLACLGRGLGTPTHVLEFSLDQPQRMGNAMIYEYRLYTCLRGRLPALLKRFENHTVRIWEKHGIKPAGFTC
jgi:hypothetical protein